MTVLVTAASRHGSTAEIAHAIAEELTRHDVQAVVRPPEQVRTLDGYDAVVLGSGLYTGRWLSEATSLVGRCAGEWATRRVWLFSSGPVGKPDSTLRRKMTSDPAELSDVRTATGAREHRIFPGRLDRSMLPLRQRIPLMLFRGLQGDFRDWDAVRAWSAGIAEALHPTSAS